MGNAESGLPSETASFVCFQTTQSWVDGRVGVFCSHLMPVSWCRLRGVGWHTIHSVTCWIWTSTSTLSGGQAPYLAFWSVVSLTLVSTRSLRMRFEYFVRIHAWNALYFVPHCDCVLQEHAVYQHTHQGCCLQHLRELIVCKLHMNNHSCAKIPVQDGAFSVVCSRSTHRYWAVAGLSRA